MGLCKTDVSTGSQYESYLTDSNVKGYTVVIYSSLESNTQQDNTAQFTGSVHYSHYKNDINYYVEYTDYLIP